MRKLRTILVGAVLSLSMLGVLAPTPPASACMGEICDSFCDFANSKYGQKIFKNGCPVR